MGGNGRFPVLANESQSL